MPEVFQPKEQPQEKKVETTPQEPELIEFLGKKLWVDPRFAKRFTKASEHLPKGTTWELRERNDKRFIVAVDDQKKDLTGEIPYTDSYAEAFITKLETAVALQHPEIAGEILGRNFQMARQLPEKGKMKLLEGISVERIDKETWNVDIDTGRWAHQQMSPGGYFINLSTTMIMPQEDMVILLERGLMARIDPKGTIKTKEYGPLILSIKDGKLVLLRHGDGFVYKYRKEEK
ncbi:MAG: hypothetical protein PHI23_03770 [Candidatus Peribacteraceae bacterium]|nr:hypothetical protein [Candidatus Peribacteraceae bacterium]